MHPSDKKDAKNIKNLVGFSSKTEDVYESNKKQANKNFNLPVNIMGNKPPVPKKSEYSLSNSSSSDEERKKPKF